MKRGFSLIELLVVVTIIAILVGVATPYYADYVRESKRTKALQDLDVLKQAIVLFNSQEDLPYQGLLATATLNTVPILGENDFNGLQGRYLTYIPVDPWGKNYKLDPFASFVFSEGADSRTEADDIRDYYVKDLALVRVEWEDSDNDRTMNTDDLLYFQFNKPLWCSGMQDSHFLVYENNEVSTATLGFTYVPATGYAEIQATGSVLIGKVTAANNVKLGVHSLAFKDDLNTLREYKEVMVDRPNSTPVKIATKVDKNLSSLPLRYAIRSNPIKISPK